MSSQNIRGNMMSIDYNNCDIDELVKKWYDIIIGNTSGSPKAILLESQETPYEGR